MANYYSQFYTNIPRLTEAETAYLKTQLTELSDDENDAFALRWVFDEQGADEAQTLWLISDEAASVDLVAELMQQFLRRFRPNDYLAFSWANTCSTSRPDAFGGGAAFITAAEVKYLNTHHWLALQKERFKNSIPQGRVKVEVKGGVAEVIECPPGVEVEISDLD